MVDIVGKRYWYFLLSLIIILPGTISLITNGLKLGTDFTGGTEYTVTVTQPNATNAIHDLVLKTVGNVSYVQGIVATGKCPPECQYLIRTKEAGNTERVALDAAIKKQFPGSQGVVASNTVSGTIASQLTQQAIIAVAVAALAVLLYITFAFRNAPSPFRFGAAAVIAMLHDVLVVLGIFSILGATLNVEVDAPFLTAMLTIIGFSVHDTIVIFDRIRENLARRTGDAFDRVVNHSILQSFVRSINTSFTVVLTLFAVYLFTGEAIRYFVLAMLIGIISGTYSSIFNASQILVVWHNHEISRFFRRRGSTATASA